MKLKLVRHLWGVDLTAGFDRHLPRWREVGYEAVEVPPRSVPDRAALLAFLKANDLGLVVQAFTNDAKPGGSVKEHLSSLQAQLDDSLDARPLFFSVHSGSDTWTVTQAEDFYGAALEMERHMGVTIAHETHRMRYFANPWATRAILERFPALKLTCDLSHWVCVAERLLEDCGGIIALAARHCHHVHARVGYEEGPQVPDPRAPEWSRHLAAHEGWWEQIWRAQVQNGMAVSTLTPEFGPPPYLHTLPFTQAPVADLADICDWIASRQVQRCARTTTSARDSSGHLRPEHV